MTSLYVEYIDNIDDGYKSPNISPENVGNSSGLGNSTSYTPSFTRELKIANPRMNGNDVKRVQERLYELGFKEVGEADGWFGPNTEKAVKNFQKARSIAEMGVVDEKNARCIVLK